MFDRDECTEARCPRLWIYTTTSTETSGVAQRLPSGRTPSGEDIGQSRWLTATEWLRFADQVEVRAHSHVLEVGSGSGGPAVYLAAARGCRVTGVDINEHGVRNAEQLAVARGVADRVTFQTVDASQPLPFPAAR